MTAKRTLADVVPLLEEEFQAQVVDLARICGWEHMHVRRTIGKGNKWTTGTSVKGWPDLTLWTPRHGGRLIFRELKSDEGKVSAEQTAVLASLVAAGLDAAVWRPADWYEIEETLQGRLLSPVGAGAVDTPGPVTP